MRVKSQREVLPKVRVKSQRKVRYEIVFIPKKTSVSYTRFFLVKVMFQVRVRSEGEKLERSSPGLKWSAESFVESFKV